METKLNLYEILVPTVSNAGKPFRTRYHRVWDQKVQTITGGLTILAPSKGKWISKAGVLYNERMIPVRIMCNASQMDEIVRFTAKYYGQLAIMYYRISDDVNIYYPG